MKKLVKLIPLLAFALVLSACSSTEETETATGSESTVCSAESLETLTPGTLTIATGEPAYYPWVIDDEPESGEGFEAAVAYAIADELGYDSADVTWVRTSFDAAIAPGPKTFDFNLQQYSITDQRKEVVDFAGPYYQANQAIVSFAGSKLEGLTTIQEVIDSGAKLGAGVGTTSLEVVESTFGLSASVFNDNAAAVTALKNQQIDGIVMDLPTALYTAGVELDNGIIVGQVEEIDSADQGFGLLLAKDSPLTDCLNQAIDALRSSGQLATITEEWLASYTGAPVLQ
ncbi:MAG: transporter substrate-binding domain-containing protein [Candidatus Nanopelagicales bacterium]